MEYFINFLFGVLIGGIVAAAALIVTALPVWQSI